MLEDSTKQSLLEWLFGKGALNKAAAQGSSPTVSQPPLNQNTDYLKEQIKRTEDAKKAAVKAIKKAAPDAMDKLANPKPVQNPIPQQNDY